VIAAFAGSGQVSARTTSRRSVAAKYFTGHSSGLRVAKQNRWLHRSICAA